MNGRSRGVDRDAESTSRCAKAPPRAGTPRQNSSVRLVLSRALRATIRPRRLASRGRRLDLGGELGHVSLQSPAVTGFVVDTNVLSEVRKGARANPRVRERLAVNRDDLYLSVLVRGEIRRDTESIRRREAAQAASLDRWLGKVLTGFDDRILPIDSPVAERCGRLMAERTMPVIDGLLAATALVHGLTLATRNVRDLAGARVSLVNPFVAGVAYRHLWPQRTRAVPRNTILRFVQRSGGLPKCEEGDLNPKPLTKILKVFAGPTAKNRHLPPPTVSGRHIHVGVARERQRREHSASRYRQRSSRSVLRAGRPYPDVAGLRLSPRRVRSLDGQVVRRTGPRIARRRARAGIRAAALLQFRVVAANRPL